jgi:mevalonate kinase
MQLKASAPGSLMLLGEYAVLYGKPALVAAIDKRIQVILTPKDSPAITIHSSLYGAYETSLSQLKIEKPYHFVLGVLQHYQNKLKKLKQGCHLEIISEVSDQVGFGSSAAVTAATMAALCHWLNIKTTPLNLLCHGRNIIRQIQGTGSGADIAASIFGGMVAFCAHPLSAEKFSYLYPLTVLYTGFKTPTAEAIKKVQDYFSSHPQLFEYLMQAIGQCAFHGIQHLRDEHWQELGKMMNIQQGLMTSLGVSNLLMQQMVDNLSYESSILGAKISGSGLGDCVVGLGDAPITSVQRIPVNMTLQGVICEKI